MAVKPIDELKTEVNQTINTNGNRGITGATLNTAMIDTIDSLTNVDEMLDERKANIDGMYETMTVGLADNLISPDGVVNNEPYIYRTTAGSTSVSNGNAEIRQINGNSIVWNQLVQNGNFASDTNWKVNSSTDKVIENNKCTISVISVGANQLNQYITFKGGHKYIVSAYISGSVSNDARFAIYNNTTQQMARSNTFNISSTDKLFADIITPTFDATTLIFYMSQTNNNAIGDSMVIHDFTCFDLTQMFGAGNEPATVEEFEKLFPNDYYPYNAGEVISTNISSLKSVEFNQYNHTTGKADVIKGNQYQITGAYTAITYSDNTDITPDSDGFFTPTKNDTLTITGGNNTNTCVHLTWSGYRNGDYEPYVEHTISIPISSIKDVNNVQLFPDGLCSAGSVYDEITSTKAIKRIGKVDLGSLSWTYDNRFAGSGINPKQNVVLTANYVNSSSGIDKSIFIGNNKLVYIYDSSYTDAAAFKAAMSGVYMYYELATPIEVDFATTPQDFGTVLNLTYKEDDFGTEEFIKESGKDMTTIVKASTFYMANLRDKIRNIDGNTDAAALMIPSVDEMLDTLGDTLNGTITKTWDETNKKWTFSNSGDSVDERLEDMKSGAYPDMTVGNLISDTSIPRKFYYDKTAGEGNEIGSGHTTVNSIKGNSIVWNQLLNVSENNFIKSGCSVSYIDGVYEITPNSAEVAFIANIKSSILVPPNHKVLHKISVKSGNNVKSCKITTSYPSFNFIGTADTSITGLSATEFVNVFGISSVTLFDNNTKINPEGIGVYVPAASNNGEKVYIKNLQFIDLTQMFGAGNEPATVEEFEKMFPSDYYPYNEGQLISLAPTAVQSTGFNLWDEEWELGRYSIVTGNKENASDQIRSKNYIKVFPNSTYYIHVNGLIGAPQSAFAVLYYDSNKNYIRYNIVHNNNITISSNCEYITFMCGSLYGTTYNHDICISLSDPNRNGTYLPYQQSSADLSWIQTLTYTPEGSEEPELLFPDGLCRAGTVYDEVTPTKAIKRIGKVDLGSLDWHKQNGYDNDHLWASNIQDAMSDLNSNVKANAICGKYETASAFGTNSNNVDKIYCIKYYYSSTSNLYIADSSYTDAAAFKSAMSGVYLYYELATPIEIPINKTISYAVQPGGTEQLLPENLPSVTPTTSQIIMDVTYPLDAVGTIKNLPVNYISAESMTAFINAINGAAVGFTVSMAYNSGTGKYGFTVTKTPQQTM